MYRRVCRKNMNIYVRGSPSYNSLVKWEKEALINPLLETIKDFYKNAENRSAFEKWQQKRLEKEIEIRG